MSEYRTTDLRHAGKSRATRCPTCGKGWPIVQAFWELQTDGQRILINCCTRCAKYSPIHKLDEATGEYHPIVWGAK